MIRPAHAIAGAALVLPTLAVFAPKGATPLFMLCCALALLSAEGRRAALDALREPLAWLLAALLGWSLLSLAWSPDPAGGFALWLRIAALFAAGLALGRAAATLEDAAPVLRALPLGLVLGLVAAAVESGAGNPIRFAFTGPREDAIHWIGHWLNRGMTALALLVWPAAAALWLRSPAKALALLLACGLVLLAGPQRAAKLAFLLSLGAAGLAWYLGPRLRAPLVAASFALCLGAPLLPGLLPQAAELRAQGLAESITHRTQIWRFVADRIAERPALGWGFDASRAIPGGDEAAAGTVGRLLPLHPHNGALQAWLELGLPGALLLAAIVGAAFAGAASLPERRARAAAVATVATAAAIGLVSYGVWQTQWLSVLALAAAFMAAAGRLNRPG